jgi:glycine cleavage system H protein
MPVKVTKPVLYATAKPCDFLFGDELMSNVPAELKYSKEHEWLRKEADGTYTVGITEHAQELLGDMVFVDLPEVGATVEAGDDCAVAESVKAASDIYAPISGEIVAVNEELNDSRSWSTATRIPTAGSSKSKPATKRRLPRCWMRPRMKLC